MKPNVSGFDGAMRVILAMLLLCYGVLFESWWGLLGIIPFATAALSWCPLYTLFGINNDSKVA
jgi:hypothetical protein